MQLSIAKTITELNDVLQAHTQQGKKTVFVPTMGALHAGHISLMELAAEQPNAAVVASIFVNPTQFGPSEDLDRYPRTIEADAHKLAAAGVDALFLPSLQTIYPDGPVSTISAGPLANRWDGEARPGHFDGVATVVSRLFDLVRPDVAIFGEKDYQQLAVIRQMVATQKRNIEIIGAPIMREVDGLAMSSRNVYLSENERTIAPKLYEVLQNVLPPPVAVSSTLPTPPAGGAGGGLSPLSQQNEAAPPSDRCAISFPPASGVDKVYVLLEYAKRHLLNAGFDKVDYLALVDGETLEPLAEQQAGARILAAAWLGTTRLIDNIGI